MAHPDFCLHRPIGFEPTAVEEELPRPEDDTAEVADWFTTARDPEVAQAVAEAEAVARKPVEPAVRTSGEPAGGPEFGTPGALPASEQFSTGWVPPAAPDLAPPASEEPQHRQD